MRLGACGVVTSGGSGESDHGRLLYREQAKAERGVTRPNIVLPTTAHVALDKGAYWMDVEVRHAGVTDDFRADVDQMADLVDDQTIAVVGSAVNYPHSLIDPIERLSDLALDRGSDCMSTDASVGSCCPGWSRWATTPPPWDFRVPRSRRSAPTPTSTATR